MSVPDPKAHEGRARARRRLLRTALFGFGALLGVLGLTLGSLVLFLESDRGRRWLVGQALERGIELDFRLLHVSPLRGHAALHGVRVAMPPSHKQAADDCLTVAYLELSWDTFSLFKGSVHVSAFHVDGVRAHVAMDEHGQNSFSKLTEALSDPARPKRDSPLSESLARLQLPIPLRIQELAIRDVEVRLTNLPNGKVPWSLEGIEIQGHLALHNGPPQGMLNLTSPASSRVTRLRFPASSDASKPEEIELRIDEHVTLDGNTVALTGSVDLLGQTIQTPWQPGDRLLEHTASVSFHPERQTTRFELERAEFLAGVGRATLLFELADAAHLPAITSGEGFFDLDSLLHWFGAQRSPPWDARGTRAALQVLPPGPDARSGTIARVRVTAEAERLRFPLEAAQLDVESAKLELESEVGSLARDIAAKLSIGELSVQAGETKLRTKSARAAVRIGEVTLTPKEALPPFEGELELPHAQLTFPGATELSLENARWELSGIFRSVEHFDLRSAVRLAALELSQRGARAKLRDAQLTLASSHRPGEGFRATGDLHAANVRATDESRMIAVSAPGKASFSLSNLRLDTHHFLASSGKIEGALRLDPFITRFDVQSSGESAQGNVDLRVRSVPEGLAALGLTESVPPFIDVRNAELSLHVQGSWSDLMSDSPSSRHRVTADVSGLGFAGQGWAAHLPRIGLLVEHAGRGLEHGGTLRLDLDQPTLNQHTLADHVTWQGMAQLDGATRSARLEGGILGSDGADLHGAVTLHLDSQAVMTHRGHLSAGGLGALAPLIPPSLRASHPISWENLTLEVESDGHLSLVDASSFRETIGVNLRGLRYSPNGVELTAPEVRVELHAQGMEGTVGGDARIRVPLLDIQDTTHHASIHGMEQSLRFASKGPLGRGPLTIELDGTIQRIEQDLLSAYAASDLKLAGRLVIDENQDLTLDRLRVDNPRGGTQLELSKELTGARGRGLGRSTRMAIRGRLTQDLARLTWTPQLFRARGLLDVPFFVDSGDGSVFRIRGNVGLRNVDVHLPSLALKAHGIRARIAIEEAVEWTPESGIVLVPFTDRNVFSRVRFQDLQPFLQDSYLEVKKLEWKQLEAGPIVGSLRVFRNVFSVDKLKVQKGDALITGQLTVDYLPGAERVQFRGNVTGLQTEGSDEPLDANASVVFSPSRLELDGRMQIVRIGKKHLLKLLDLVDPYREDASLNSLRRSLAYGYPRRVGVAFSQGLMSMKVDLGGIIGSFLDVGEVRGVPLGPFMSQHVAPLLPW